MDDRNVSAPSRRLLVIEDFADARDLYCELLSGQGFEVHAAGDGLAGLDLARIVRPHLILLDLALPRLDGFGVLSAIRHDVDAELASTPVLVISAHADQSSSKRAFELGANAVLGKPSLPDELLNSVNSLLGIAGLGRPAAP
jgi:two-component system, cell cycle response regulator DivK